MSLLVWDDRPREEAHLFNPAFCAAALHEFVKAYQNAKGAAASYALLFCVLPIAFHGKTRHGLPGSTLTSLYSWRERNPQVLVGFAERARSLRPVVQEALRFAIDRCAIEFADDGGVTLGAKPLGVARKFEDALTDDARECIAAARLLGRWLRRLARHRRSWPPGELNHEHEYRGDRTLFAFGRAARAHLQEGLP